MPTITDADRIFAGKKWIKEVKFNGQVIWESPIDLGVGSTTVQYDPSTQSGFFGFVSADDLISGDSLAAAVSLTGGTAQNSNAGWIKYVIETDVYYVAKKPFRYAISYNQIEDVVIVDGTTTITIGSRNYSVWIMKAYDEWTDHFIRIMDEWGSYSDADLGCGIGDLGTQSWCRDLGFFLGPNQAGKEGDATAIISTSEDAKTSTVDRFGWRPMLKLVQT